MTLSVLCADDDRHIRLLIGTVLERTMDAAVEMVESGAEALLRLETGPLPDVLILDLMMPGLDGYEVCKKLRADQRFKDLPIVFLTATDNDQLRHASDMGATAIIQKPFGLRDLAPKLRAALQRPVKLAERADAKRP